jgi:hypothetical protein
MRFSSGHAILGAAQSVIVCGMNVGKIVGNLGVASAAKRPRAAGQSRRYLSGMETVGMPSVSPRSAIPVSAVAMRFQVSRCQRRYGATSGRVR